ncbi:hypothetical protein A8709_24745 [Paenibacillus pectinilyticus]|uniref:Anti-sigma-W factor RsiW n=1 Tax=Paenibacillus pectinilyticus TaxID=512399 RepID=A0A1C1A9A6_9BACL|nr:zf-HC2 domain-containing protein [Paenibacillus pectinilyticus]OCT17189.1 hypothetical protein A8709_24745 [Paenibacillus pectinilyticus]
MKCQEVMIYMQRQLDGDLAPNEEDELHAHLRHCLDCAEMFERLQALSDELSQLPKVMPPFSLVDAIMPQLLQLDQQSENESVTDNVIAFHAPAAVQETEERSPRSGVTRFKNQFSWKIASGVVAAGLILGFFAFNLGHPVIDQADGFRLLKSSSDTKAAPEKQAATASGVNHGDESSDVVKKMKGDSTSNQASQDAPNADTFAIGTSKPEVTDRSGGAVPSGPQTTTDAKIEKPDVISSPIGGSDTMDRQTSPSTTAPARMVVPDHTASSGTASKDQVSTTLSPTPGSVAPSTPNDVKLENPNKKTTPVPLTDPASADRTDANLGVQSFIGPQIGASLKSATGTYVADIENTHVVIRNSNTLEVVFTSNHVWQSDDEIKLLEWTKDDNLFYQVTSKGSIQTLLINISEKTEASK